MLVAPIALAVPALLGTIGLGSSDASAAPLIPTPACGDDDDDDPTPRQTEGPYFTPNSPKRASLLEPGIAGTRLVVTGTVLTRGCRPIANALVDFWQCDGAGNYDNVGYRLRGHQFTDARGVYRLETIAPGIYPGRTRHIHVKVQAPRQQVLTTQLYFPNERRNDRDRIFDPELLIRVADASEGRQGRFDFVLDLA
jgi:protocatechuate 3,4-dioxygenase beta subunit